MKRHGNLFDQIACFENLLAAAKAAYRGKRFRDAPAEFHFALEANLLWLLDDLRSGNYKPGPYRSFRIFDPKERLISAAPYRDRVVHHAVCRIVDGCGVRPDSDSSDGCASCKKNSPSAARPARKSGLRWPVGMDT